MRNPLCIIRKITVPVLCLIVGGAMGYSIRSAMIQEQGQRELTEIREGGYRLINPLLECEGDRDLIRNHELQPFRAKVEDYLKNRMRYPDLEAVSVYFRELNDGIWFVVGEAERFTPASMRKVPMMIALLKQAERDPGLLSRRIVARLKQDHNAYQNFKPAEAMEPGREYTVADLVKRMIVHSDNNAFFLLSGIVDMRQLDAVYSLLAVRDPVNGQGPGNPFTIQTYASFFRILYNATYLNKDMSDLALDLLTRVDFHAGVVQGVAPGVTVAHKFGEHSGDPDGKKQLHDCGIVYHPRHPYLLCVMTTGASFDYLDEAIASVSKIIYAEVEHQHGTEHR